MNVLEATALREVRPSTGLRYGVAALVVAFSLVSAELLRFYEHTEPYASSFLCAVMFAAWYGGVGAGLLALMLSALAFDYFALAPRYSFLMESTEIPRLVILVGAASFVILLNATQRAAADLLRRTRDELQDRVHELADVNQKLQRSQAYLEEAQRLSNTGSFGWDTSTGDMIWSKELYRIYEIDPKVKPTVDLALQFVHPDDREFVRHEIVDAAADRQEFYCECRVLMPDDTIKHVNVHARRVKYPSGDEEIIGALMDITAARQAQEALQSMRAELAHVARVVAFGAMGASIAHEVNQPLGAIVINGEAGVRWLTRDPPDIDEALAAVQRIIHDARRASVVVGRVRDLARKTRPDVTELDLNAVIDETIGLIRGEILRHGVTMKLELAPGLPMVRGDRIQLQQVIINLAINAAQAMAMIADRVRTLIIRSLPHDDNDVIVAVEDAGIGVDPEALDRLFSPFYTTKSDGMGIGLSVCRSIIEAHGGRVWASPNAGPGMTFQFTVAVQQ
jgi:signal transduction histidine kinase